MPYFILNDTSLLLYALVQFASLNASRSPPSTLKLTLTSIVSFNAYSSLFFTIPISEILLSTILIAHNDLSTPIILCISKFSHRNYSKNHNNFLETQIYSSLSLNFLFIWQK